MRNRYKSAYDFDSDWDYYEYLNGSNTEDEEREPEEPEEEYRETDDRNYPSNDIRWHEW